MGQKCRDLLDVVAGLITQHGGGVAQGVDGDPGGVEAGTAGVFLEEATYLASGEGTVGIPGGGVHIWQPGGFIGKGGKDWSLCGK